MGSLALQRSFASLFLGALVAGVFAASGSAQTVQSLNLVYELGEEALDVTLEISGEPGGKIWLAVAPEHLATTPAATQWGALYVDPGAGALVEVFLDTDGSLLVQTSFPRPLSNVVYSAQALGFDATGAATMLSNPVTFMADQGNALAYVGGAYVGTGTGNGNAGDKVEVVAVGKPVNGKPQEVVMASGTVVKGKSVTLQGRVKPVNGKAPVKVVLRVKGKDVAFVVC